MTPPGNIEARLFYRAALQRFEDARLILLRLNRPTAATYLAGYAVECGLKALLLTRASPRKRTAVLDTFRGRRGHDLSQLVESCRLAGAGMPATVARSMSEVVVWSVDQRYDPRPGDSETAQRFIAATESILAWIKRSI